LSGVKKSYKLSLVIVLTAVLIMLVSQGVTGGISAKAGRFNMSYIYFGNPADYTDYIDKAQGSIDDISPSFFDLNEDGTLKLTGAVSHEFVKYMHQRGIKVTPFLSNHWDRQKGINALAIREALATQIVLAIDEYGLDGVNVDIENVTEAQRDSYTDFVRLLKQKLPPGKSLSVAVAPNPWGLTSGWHGSYDYKALAEYSDYLMIMAYDEHYQGSAPGPVAGYPFVEDTIKAALKLVPADKLVLGIPFYGRLWKQGVSYGGYGISNNTVEELIKSYRGKVVYDEKERSPKATITILKSDKKPKVLGRELDAGVYDIWYENAQSIKNKLSLVAKYNLKGTGSWSLGQEADDTWKYYSLWLNGKYFSDIQNSWAKDSIMLVAQKGWMIGGLGSKFAPESSVTRAEAVTTLVRALDLEIVAGDKKNSAFSDTASHWAFDEIETAYKNGLVKGMLSGKFMPDGKLTREEIAVMLDRILGLSGEEMVSLADVEDSSEAWGDSSATGLDSSEGGWDSSEDVANPFPDVSEETSPWSFEAIARCKEAGILSGYPDGKFCPKKNVTRAEFASIIERAAKLF